MNDKMRIKMKSYRCKLIEGRGEKEFFFLLDIYLEIIYFYHHPFGVTELNEVT